MGLWKNAWKSDSTQEYKDAMSGFQRATDKAQSNLETQSNLNNQYAGNTGYGNSLQQGMQGAAVTAGQAGANAARAARNTGMAGARAAALGAQQAADAYGSNIANQQAMAANMGQSAIAANQGLTGQQMNLAGQRLSGAGMEQSEAQNKFNRANKGLDRAAGVVGNIGQGLASVLSDERMKDIQDRTDNLSKLVENIDLYDYKYTDEAQKEYPEETDDKEKVGVMAQELENNPVTESSVKEDENGIKHVDTKQLSLQAIGLISDLSKRLSELEQGDK